MTKTYWLSTRVEFEETGYVGYLGPEHVPFIVPRGQRFTLDVAANGTVLAVFEPLPCPTCGHVKEKQ